MNPVVPGGGLLLLKLALSLGAVVGLILLLQKAARKWGHALGAGGGGEVIRLLSQRSVGPRLSLAVVEVRGRTLLVGISPQGIHAVADLDASSARETAGPAARAPESASGFAASEVAGGHGFPPAAPLASAVGAAHGTGGALHPAAATPLQSLLERWGLRPRGSARFAAALDRGPGSDRPAVRRGTGAPVVFEEELMARLASLRDRYPSLADFEADAGEARR